MGFDQNPQSVKDRLDQLSWMLGGQSAVPAMPQQQSANPFDLVDGIEGARELLGKMLASTRRVVWDKSEPIFYGLEKDANGNAAAITINRFTTEREPTPEEKMAQQMAENYMTKADFAVFADDLKTQLAHLMAQMTSKQEVTDNG